MTATCVAVLSSAALLLAAAPAQARSDAWVVLKTKLALATNTNLGAADTWVDAVGGDVVLHGTVASDDQRLLAEIVTRAVPGVRSVRNMLRVVPPPAPPSGESTPGPAAGAAGDDGKLQTAVAEALRQSGFRARRGVRVAQVSGGIVALVGQAASLAEEWEAVTAAKTVPGVLSVVSQIRSGELVLRPERRAGKGAAVAPAASAIAQELALIEAVKLRLAADQQLPAPQVFVDARGNTVTLFGTVPTALAKTGIEVMVRGVPGVAELRNELDIATAEVREPTPPAGDAELQRDVGKALRLYPELRGVRATARGGLIALGGSVRDRWQRLQAVVVARRVPGVRAVTQEIAVGKPQRGKKHPQHPKTAQRTGSNHVSTVSL